MSWPGVIYNEEVIREGFGIEDVGIPLAPRSSCSMPSRQPA